jgi:hypothetical protein
MKITKGAHVAGTLLLSCFVVTPVSAGQATAGQTKVTKAERAERRAARFRAMDVNGDRVITREEWRGNIQAFNRRDLNRDGQLSGNEIWPADGAVDSANPTDWRENAERDNVLEQVYRRADRNQDGIISRDEWTSDPTTFSRVDANSDGVITRPEYLGNGWSAESALAGPATPAEARRDSPGYQSGYDRGLADGRQAGKEDKQYRNQWDLEGQRELEQADAGYTAALGARANYQAGYRAGFRAGYRQGFGPRDQN